MFVYKFIILILNQAVWTSNYSNLKVYSKKLGLEFFRFKILIELIKITKFHYYYFY